MGRFKTYISTLYVHISLSFTCYRSNRSPKHSDIYQSLAVAEQLNKTTNTVLYYDIILEDTMEGYLSKKSIHINESYVHAIALALW